MAVQDTFQDFLTTGVTEISATTMIIALLLSALLAFILGNLYIRYGHSLSNRKKFANNFILLATTTTLIITIVKSSLALSLGLVGALSIVRFRAAIKEPEELAFLFLCIAIGLGTGAGQLFITTLSFIIISLLIFTRHLTLNKQEQENLHLAITGKNITLEKVSKIITKHTEATQLKRFDKAENGELEIAYLIDISSLEKLTIMKKELEKLSRSIKISYLDKTGIW